MTHETRQAASTALPGSSLPTSLSLSHESFMPLVCANPPVYLCLYSKAQPSSVKCSVCTDLILRQTINFYMNLDQYFLTLLRENATHVSQIVTYINFNPLTSHCAPPAPPAYLNILLFNSPFHYSAKEDSSFSIRLLFDIR